MVITCYDDIIIKHERKRTQKEIVIIALLQFAL